MELIKKIGAAIAAEAKAFWDYLEGKKRAISIVVTNGANLAQYIGTEWAIQNPNYYHVIHLAIYLFGMLGLVGVASAAMKNKPQ